MSDAPSTPTGFEEAFERFVELHQRGQRVDPVAYAARHPPFEGALLEALYAYLVLEHATPNRAAALPPGRGGDGTPSRSTP